MPLRCQQGLGCAKSCRTEPAPSGRSVRSQYYAWRQSRGGGICVAPVVLLATGCPRGNVNVGLATSMVTGSSKPHQPAANADESELRLDISLHMERILIFNYHLIHQGQLPARKPQLQSSVFMQSLGTSLRRGSSDGRESTRWMALTARGDAKPWGCCVSR